jgi:hypothetical protein
MALANVVIKGRVFPYELSGPYIFKSGKKKGQSVESLMFSDRAYLVYLKSVLDSEIGLVSVPNKLHLHLGWILNAGEFVRSSKTCQYCSGEFERRKIQLFSVRWSCGASYGHHYVCCSDGDCKSRIFDEKSSFLPLKFSSLSHFGKGEQKRVGTFFKEIFLGAGRLDPERAFELFFSASQAQIVG